MRDEEWGYIILVKTEYDVFDGRIISFFNKCTNSIGLLFITVDRSVDV